MKLRFFNLKFFIVLVLAIFAIHPAFAFDPKVQELSQQKLPILEEPDITIKTLDNGLTVYYLQDAELPLFHLATFFEAGSIHDDFENRGLSDVFMSAWRSGGAKGLPPEKVDETLEFYAASISADAGEELSSFEMTSLQKNAKEILDVYFALLQKPAFDQSRLDIIKQAELNGIKRRNEEPMSIAMREYLQSLYGPASPHSWMSTPETIQKMDQAKLQDYFQKNIGTNRAWIAAVSPLSFDDFMKLISPYMKDWNHQVEKKTYPTNLAKDWQPSTEFIQKAGNQSAIIVGHFGDKRFNPDRFKLTLANEILGGATFGSKLGDRIRTDLGLAYGIQSDFQFDSDFGPFLIATRTKSESTMQTLTEMKRILADMVTGKNISKEELELARERVLNRLVFEYENPFNIVKMRVRYDYFGYPPNYLAVFQKEIENVTLDGLKEVLDKYLFPERLKVLIVGDKAGIPDLKTLPGLTEKPLDWE